MYRLCRYLAAMMALTSAPAFAAALMTERVNVNPTTGLQADGISYSPVLSGDGCVVAFVSQSSTLAPPGYGLTTGSPAQVYAMNRCVIPHTLELVSVTNDGSAAADNGCSAPNISADGRYVAFVTAATNLPVPGSGQNGAPNGLYVRDRLNHTTLSPLEAWRPRSQNNGSIGVDGSAALRYMSDDASTFVFDFRSPPAVQQNLYIVHYSAGVSTLQPLCAANDIACLTGTSDYLAISGDGGTVVLQSTYAFDGGSSNGFYNVYTYNVATAVATRASLLTNGSAANQSVDPLSDLGISGDGHEVAFSSGTASNFPGDINDTLQLKNVPGGAVTLLSATVDGTPEKIGYGIALPKVSADGNRVAFTSENQLVPHNYQVGYDAIVADLSLGRLASACISASGSTGTNGCDGTTLSQDGRFAAFRSNSTNLVPNDTNVKPDIFVVALDPAIDLIFATGFEP